LLSFLYKLLDISHLADANWGGHEQLCDSGEPFTQAFLKKEVDEIMVGGRERVVFGCS
jgi:hypothetical protein